MRRAFQLADITIEGHEIVSQERFQAAGPRFGLAAEPPPHGHQDAQDGAEGYNFFQFMAASLADSEVPAHTLDSFRCPYVPLLPSPRRSYSYACGKFGICFRRLCIGILIPVFTVSITPSYGLLPRIGGG